MAASAKVSPRKWKAGTNMASPLGSLEELSTVARFARGEPIYVSGEPAEFWYRILSGAGRKCAFARGGSRQIVDFLRPGDLFGYDAQDVHSFSAEAIVSGTTVARYPRCGAERVADSDPQIARRIRQLIFDSVDRIQRRMLILGRRATALEKVGSFLLDMVDRFRAGSVGAVSLPMSRYDIADYLAMSPESVSRALTNLREGGLIEFESVRCVQICDRESLERISESPMSETGTRSLSPGQTRPAHPAEARLSARNPRHRWPVAFN